MGQITNETAKGQLVPLVFAQDAVAASQTDVQLNIIETGATTGALDVAEYVMPFAGEIVAVSYALSAAATAGSLGIGATVNGTEDADTTQTVTTAQRGYGKVLREKARFVAGDRIGAEITTSGTWDATTADLAVTVWVLLQIEGI